MKVKTALTIAGSDCSGGAGIQADIKTMTMQGVYAMSAVTALTAQNTEGVKSIYEVSASFLEDQLDMIFTDIHPDAVKIGMVSSEGLIDVIARKLKQYGAKNIVVDPVMVSTSGSSLLKNGASGALSEMLFPLAEVITPNIPEAEALSGMEIKSGEEMMRAAEYLGKRYGCAVLLKGGHSVNNANDILYSKDGCKVFSGKRINNHNTHGTGCTLSSAIAAGLAKGYPLHQAVGEAKKYISVCLEAMLDLGKGSGPLLHNAELYSLGE